MDEQLTAEQFYRILAERGNRQPYYGHLGIHVERVDESGSYVRLELDPKLAQFHGVAHGGVAASLIDSAIGMAVAGSEIGGVNSMTLELKLNYLRPLPIGEAVTAHGWVTNKTRRTIFGEAEIRDKDGKLLAKGAATFIRVERELVIGELLFLQTIVGQHPLAISAACAIMFLPLLRGGGWMMRTEATTGGMGC